jgi:CDP-glucose 4,6-dehydratase
MNYEYYAGKKVLITGHTGFKGSWMCKVLIHLGAQVIGYSLESPTSPSLFELAGVEKEITHYIGDVRDYDHLKEVFDLEQPEVVFHLAAQPLVRESYVSPRTTYETNVMGTVNVMECCRNSKSVRSILNVTTDKVYHNNEWNWGYRENERMDGYDPYSNSKSCSELVTWCYDRSFFASMEDIRLSTARAGNVIGGGDFSADRIIPDCIRAVLEGKQILVRNPNSIRPYQHVLEPLFAYLLLAERQVEDSSLCGAYNVGPNEDDCIPTGKLADLFAKYWSDGCGWYTETVDGPHEANFLKLDCSKIKYTFGWQATWNVANAVEKTIEWTKAWNNGEDISSVMNKQITEFIEKGRN